MMRNRVCGDIHLTYKRFSSDILLYPLSLHRIRAKHRQSECCSYIGNRIFSGRVNPRTIFSVFFSLRSSFKHFGCVNNIVYRILLYNDSNNIIHVRLKSEKIADEIILRARARVCIICI